MNTILIEAKMKFPAGTKFKRAGGIYKNQIYTVTNQPEFAEGGESSRIMVRTVEEGWVHVHDDNLGWATILNSSEIPFIPFIPLIFN